MLTDVQQTRMISNTKKYLRFSIMRLRRNKESFCIINEQINPVHTSCHFCLSAAFAGLNPDKIKWIGYEKNDGGRGVCWPEPVENWCLSIWTSEMDSGLQLHTCFKFFSHISACFIAIHWSSFNFDSGSETYDSVLLTILVRLYASLMQPFAVGGQKSVRPEIVCFCSATGFMVEVKAANQMFTE